MRRTLLFALTLSAVAPAVAIAQPRGDQQALRQQVRERVRTMIVWRLTEALGLDAATAQRFFPVLNQYEDRIAPLHQSQGARMRELRAQIDSGRADVGRVNQLLDEMAATRAQVVALEAERIRELRRVLSPVQSAKLVMALPQIERELHQHVRKAMNLRDEE
jgi:Spy/CpxP family protein refolding chaperone